MPSRTTQQSLARSAPRLLAIDLPETALTQAMQADARLAAGSLAAARLADLDAGLLARMQPDLVLAPLLGDGFDILDVAASLSAAAFQGRLVAVCPHLPNPRGVLSELRGHCKGFSVELSMSPP